MPRPKSVTIRLSPKQRDELKRLTGEDHAEVMFESVKTYSSGKIASTATLASKTAPAVNIKRALRGKAAPTGKVGISKLKGKAAPTGKVGISKLGGKAAPTGKVGISKLRGKAAPTGKVGISKLRGKAAPRVHIKKA